jgi:hypothetical protein
MKSGKKANNGKNRKNKSNRRNRGNKLIVQVPKGLVAPTRLSVTLRFAAVKNVYLVANQAANIRFNPVYAYDIDPAFASTAMPGFTEYGGLYKAYRVQAATIRVKAANSETSELIAYVVAVNSDPGANYSAAVATTQLAQPDTKQVMLGASSGDSVGTLVLRESTQRFAGVWNRNIYDNYVGTMSGAAPNNAWYFSVGVYSYANMAVRGLSCMIVIDVDLEFFELTNPSA